MTTLNTARVAPMNDVVLAILVAVPAVGTICVAVSRAVRGMREERREWRDAVIVALDRNSAAIEAQTKAALALICELSSAIAPRVKEGP